jgi:hypothetical protein
MVRQFGDVGKTEGRCAPFDGVGATENPVEFLILCAAQVQIKQYLLHLIQVFAGFFEKYLVELTQIEVCPAARLLM